MDNDENNRLDDIQFHRNHFIKTFFLIHRPEIFTLYAEVTGNWDLHNPLDPLSRNHFVNSKELHDFVYARVAMISDFMLDAIAYGEMAYNLGLEMHTDECTIYIAMPVFTHDNVRSISDQEGALRQIATRCFITILCHMFFKDLYGKPFKILKGRDGWFSMNESYQYVRE